MVKRRTAKSKGNQMEYSVRDSSQKIIIEVKKHKGFSWNELEKYFLKLEKRIKANKDENDTGIYIPYLIFQGNHQPCLVMHIILFLDNVEHLVVDKFNYVFGVDFIKHKGNRK